MVCEKCRLSSAFLKVINLGLQVDPAADKVGTPAQTYALSRAQGFGTEVKKRILLGTYALSAE
jgi:Asp-tRNA(Asn)/Glu-tRNA(Gln) amidotransferase A subunit family amidase